MDRGGGGGRRNPQTCVWGRVWVWVWVWVILVGDHNKTAVREVSLPPRVDTQRGIDKAGYTLHTTLGGGGQ